uniref:Aldehyde dehydrogenase n=1 Tax=OCS116 cluster bacterium TaxID=2030921 RepID=A0A2A4YZ08_9PROT
MEIFEKQKKAFAAHSAPTFAARMADLGKLYAGIKAHQDEIVEAISADFGHRSAFETRMAETSFILVDIKHTQKHLKSWMRRKRRKVALHFMPASNYVDYVPKGVVGILSPWNYPFQLSMAPLVAAIAAGNRVMIKPSEYTPKCNAVIKDILAEIFDEKQVAMVEGGADVAAEFSALAFDHLFFTGSGRVGKYVLQAAAKNLTPVTLELGGQSPAIVGADYSIKKAAKRIMVGKLLNAGQTCIAPDHVLVPQNKISEMVQALLIEGRKLYPSIMGNDEYSAIINDAQLERLCQLRDNAVRDGAVAHKLYNADDEGGKMMPVILDHVSPLMGVMREEIFGPILPVVGYESLDKVIEFVKGDDQPLAAYYFSHDRVELSRLSAEILCGNVTINDTLFHVAQNDLPFGGIGASGMGNYHGYDGFKTFSHAKGVFKQARINGAGMLNPPYSKLARRVIEWLG